jgi:hypothetical protein
MRGRSTNLYGTIDMSGSGSHQRRHPRDALNFNNLVISAEGATNPTVKNNLCHKMILASRAT